MKKKLFMAAILLALCLGCLFSIGTAAEEEAPSVSIDYVNLSFSDSVYIKYAVAAPGAVPDDVRLLVWREADENGYAYGTQKETVLPAYLDTVNGQQYIIFDYKNIAAKEMSDDVYVRAVVEVDGVRYESEAVKYSVLRYAYDTQNDDTTDTLDDLMADMRDYGTSAQKHFGYKTDTPINGTWYDITVENGRLADGFASGLFYENTEITLTANAAPEGYLFSGWRDSTGAIVSTEATGTVTVRANDIYTAVYETAVAYSEGLRYTENKDAGGNVISYTVSDIGTCTDTDVIIPKIHNGLPVTGIGTWAFENCYSLTSITIPDSVTSIGDGAFYGCTSLTSITIPNSVTSIGISAFGGCTSLESITVSAGNTVYHSAGNCLIETATKTLIAGCKNSVIPNDGSVTSIGEGAFGGCSSLTSITIPNSVTSIGGAAFSACSSLGRITIPVSVTSIGDYAFQSCSNLTSITIPDSVTSIGNYAFSSCASLTSITIPDSVTSIGDGAFHGCSSLTDITIPDSVTSIGDYAFYGCSSLESITIRNSVTSIGIYAFYDCKSLERITIGNSVTSIGKWAFSGCSRLTGITIPDSVTSIGDYAFRDCESLTIVTIGNSVTSIGEWAFYDCKSLTSITIPDSVTSIGRFAFYGCSSLTCVTFKNPAGWWYASSSDATSGTAISKTYLADPAIAAPFLRSTYSGNYWKRTDSSGLAYSVNDDGITCTITGMGTCWDTEIVIPAKIDGYTVTAIGDMAFFGNSALTSITIPDSVTSIGDMAFYGCSRLTSITIPDSVANIGLHAFRSCSSLTSVTFENTTGWWYTDTSSDTAIDANDLADPAKAAEHLTSTYINYYWYRN